MRLVYARRQLLMVAASAAVMAGLLAGCSSGGTTRIIGGNATYTMDEVQKAASAADLGAAARLTIDDAPQARKDALIELRTRGDVGAAVADLLTKEFGAQTRSVPVSVESATVGDTKVWIVIEAAPGEAERLTTRRLWVFARVDGSVVQSASYR